jgi:rhodanese-related sulfurtransferase
MNMKKPAISLILVALLLSTFVLIRPAIAEEPEYQNISVQEANEMITQNPNLVILDVRNESEYKLGHLYDAILIPLHELEDRIEELAPNQNDTVIVYCKAGSRSAPASQILTDNGFNSVYNMVGGINAWMQADYSISTSHHQVTVDVAENGSALIDIQPFLLYQLSCLPCNEGCSNTTVPITTNSSVTVLEESANYTKTLISYIENDTLVELLLEKNLLWSYNEYIEGVNRTITFVLTNITDENTNVTRQIYGLADSVQTAEYNMTMITGLDPLESGSYNSSVTTMSYIPAHHNETFSAEKIGFNSSVTLAEQYDLLSQVSQNIADEYGTSPDETLHIFEERYHTIALEFALLSNIVETNLQNYDHMIVKSTATILDDALSCFACYAALTALIGGGCIIICAVSLLLACSLCLGYGWAIEIILGMGIGPFCESQGLCP